MKRLFLHPLPDSSDRLMTKAGYVQHCVENGRICYHRRLNESAFPRFHALVSVLEKGMEIDLHFDALDSIDHKGNHDKTWAYAGGRIDEEMRRIIMALKDENKNTQTYSSTSEPTKQPSGSKLKGLLHLILKRF